MAVEVRHEPRRGRKVLLVSLRVATALLAWAVAVQPRWIGERTEQVEGRLAVLFDASRSMTLPRGEEARARRAQALAARWASASRLPVATFSFGERLATADMSALGERYAAQDDQSRRGAALASLLAQDQGEIGGVVVVSDGADRTGGLDPARLAHFGARIHTVAVAEPDLRDDAIVEVQADPVGFLRRQARVRVVVRALGGSGGPVPVTLRRGEEVEREVVVELGEDGSAEVEIPFTPGHLGRAVDRVSIPRAADDAVPENNERAFLVRVVRDKLRVLLVAGQPSWDERFLRAFLKRDPATDLISFFILRSTSDLTMAGADELALIPFPTDELFNEHLGSFDLVVFQNFEYGPYQMAEYLPRIRDYVLRGGSFAMIGGPISFASGGYAQTPIAEILPVDLPPPGTPDTRTVVTDRFHPRLSEGLERHPLLALLPDVAQSAAAWSALAPLNGANVVSRVRPGAAVLLEHPSHRMQGGGALPILVLGGAGRGRTLALTTDTTWRWGITTGGLTGDASAYERFWDRAVRWLARDPALEPARVTTDRERYGPGARARVEAVLRDARYAPYGERDAALVLLGDGESELGRAPVRTDAEGRASATLVLPRAAGAYRVQARLPFIEDPIAEEWLVVEAGGDELADPRADVERLRALSEATGGRFVAAPEDAPLLGDFDATRTRSLGTEERAPFGTPWAIAALVALFAAEWVVRRRWGRR
ncbi:MAG: hypothetical protein IT378_12075 [Sandaracinaceae bacterium]|nr:hypothetical protein [Sandaracinaceae bacterium]